MPPPASSSTGSAPPGCWTTPAIEELRARPEALWGDVVSLAGYAQQQGWLTAYQAQELRGRPRRPADRRRLPHLRPAGRRARRDRRSRPCTRPCRSRFPCGCSSRTGWPRSTPRPTTSPASTPPPWSRARTWPPSSTPAPTATPRSSSRSTSTVATCSTWSTRWGPCRSGWPASTPGRRPSPWPPPTTRAWPTGTCRPLTLLLTPVKQVTGSNGDVSIRPRPGATIKLAELACAPAARRSGR